MSTASLLAHAPLTDDTNLVKGVGLPTFARSSVANYHKNGAVLSAAVDESRHDGTAIIMEGAATNLMIENTDMSVANGWGANNVTTTAFAGIAPDLSQNASLIIPTTTDTFHALSRAIAVSVTPALHTVSVYCKPSGYNYLQIGTFFGIGFGAGFVNFLLVDDGEVTTESSGDIVGTIEKLSNGWYRVSITAETDGSGSLVPSFTFSPLELMSVGESYIGNGIAGGFLWGCQVEERANQSTIIFTGATADTRAEDELSYLASNWPTLDTAFTAVIDVETSDSSGVQTVITLPGIPSSSPIVVSSPIITGTYGGITSSDLTQPAFGSRIRVGMTWQTGGDQKLYDNGALVDTDTASDAGGTLTELRLGRLSAGTFNFFGRVANLRIYSDQLSDIEMANELKSGAIMKDYKQRPNYKVRAMQTQKRGRHKHRSPLLR